MGVSGAALKLERASEHVAAVGVAVQEWLASGALTIERCRDASGRTEARVRAQEQPPARLAAIVGDAAHNLRAALDHAVFEAAARHAGGVVPADVEERLMFPIIETGRAEFDRKARRHLPGVPAAVRDVIEFDQPYRYNDAEHPFGFRFHPIWRVNELDRIDKHRRLAVTATAISRPYVTVPEGVDPQTEFRHAEGPVRDGQLLVSYTGAEAGVSSFFDPGVVVTDAFAGSSPVVGMLEALLRHVAYVVWRVQSAAAASAAASG